MQRAGGGKTKDRSSDGKLSFRQTANLDKVSEMSYFSHYASAYLTYRSLRYVLLATPPLTTTCLTGKDELASGGETEKVERRIEGSKGEGQPAR